MLIKVEQRHIESGVRRDCEMCPVALALLDAGLRCVQAGRMKLSGLEQGRFYVWDTPASVLTFIDAFDHEYLVYPFEFNLNLNSED